MKASGGFGKRWIILSKKAVFPMIGERVPGCLCTRGKVTVLCAVHTELLSYCSNR